MRLHGNFFFFCINNILSPLGIMRENAARKTHDAESHNVTRRKILPRTRSDEVNFVGSVFPSRDSVEVYCAAQMS